MIKFGIKKISALLVLTSLVGVSFGAEYAIDTSHSEILFKVKHMGISTVTGRFEKFGGTFSVDPKNVKATSGKAEIDASSITTANAKRDGHLKKDDFFNVEKFPTIHFVSKEVTDVNTADSTCTLVGSLTMRGVTKDITLKVKGGGVMVDPWGNERAAFSATGRINRMDYGLTWNKALETGGFVVAPEVELALSFEGIRKADAPKEMGKSDAKAPKKPAMPAAPKVVK